MEKLFLSILVVFLVSACSSKKNDVTADAQKEGAFRIVSCLLRNCGKSMVVCMFNGECRSQLMGIVDCVSDNEDEQMICFIKKLSSPRDKMIDMMSCWGGSGCMPTPESDCPLPTNRDQIAPVTLEDLEGDWYVIRGLSPVYDCWDCQRYSFRQVSPTESKYNYTYFPGEDGVPRTVECTTTAIPFAPGESDIMPGRFRVDYRAYGMAGVDDWFCLSYRDSRYILIYYCGVNVSHSYLGGIVLSRNLDTNIPQEVHDAFANALANAGLSEPVIFDDLCVPDNSSCAFK